MRLINQVLLDRHPMGYRGEGLNLLPKRWIEPFGIQCLLAVPLVARERVIGLLVLDHQSDNCIIPADKVDLAVTIGSQVAFAVENAKLYEQTNRARQNMQTIVDEAPSGIMVVDSDLKVVTLNTSAANILGYRGENLLGRRISEVLDSQLWGPSSLLARAIESKKRAGPEEIVIKSVRRLRDVLLAATPVREGYLLYFSDVTELKEVERIKSSIVANVSHELRAPLASIKAYTELLLGNLDGDDPALRQHFLTVIAQEVDWLTDLVNDFLDIARLESKRFAPHMELLSLPGTVKGVIAALESQARAQDVSIDIQVPNNLPHLAADRELLLILLKNLVGNAIKFSPSGGRVVIKACAVGDSMALSVSDEGMGIPVEDQSQLFTRFYRSEAARNAQIRGTGLGLALVKDAVDAHQGKISVESGRGLGSTFKVVLPLGQVDISEMGVGTGDRKGTPLQG